MASHMSQVANLGDENNDITTTQEHWHRVDSKDSQNVGQYE